MKARNATLWMSLMAVAIGVQTGCTTIAKEGISAAMGVEGIYAPIQPVSPDKQARPLGQYSHFELGEVTDDFGGQVPPDLLMHLRIALPAQLAEKKLPDDPGGKTLLIRGRILHYEQAGRVMGLAAGSLEEAVARMELVDKDTGRVIGQANCIGRSTTRVNLGVAKKGEGLAKAIVAWLDDQYPKEDRQ